MNDDEAERIAKLLTAEKVDRLVEQQAEELLLGQENPLAAFEPRSNPLRDLYIAKYGSEAAADARLAEEARRDAARAEFPTAELPASLQAWKAKDLWSERELQDLCCGTLPDPARASSAAVNEAAEAIRRAVLAGTLPVASQPMDATQGDRMYAHARFFAPKSATEWASSRFSDFPFKPADFGLTRDSPADAERELSTRERDSVLRILYGMACAEPYRYDPSAARNEATAIIASATAAAGCAVDADTVRKYLKEAADKFGKAGPANR